MFFKRKKRGAEEEASAVIKGSTKVPDGAPLVALDDAAAQKVAWFERYGQPTVMQNRLFIISLMVGAVAIGEGVALSQVYPFVKPIPYIVRVNDDGKPVGQVVKATDFSPEKNEKMYFLSQFSIQLMEIDKAKSGTNFRTLSQQVLLKGAIELSDFRSQTQLFTRLAQTPNLTRVVKVKTVTMLPSTSTYEAALVRIATDEQAEDSQVIHKDWLLTVHFKVIPPSKEDEIYQNPMGIYITHFGVQEDTA